MVCPLFYTVPPPPPPPPVAALKMPFSKKFNSNLLGSVYTRKLAPVLVSFRDAFLSLYRVSGIGNTDKRTHN